MSELKEALQFESQEAALSLEEMMQEMLGNVEDGGGYTGQEIDEYTIRKMTLARNYLTEEITKLKNMKSAVSSEWDRRINKKQEEINSIDGLVQHFINNQNKGKALALDVATISNRKVPHSFKIQDQDKIRDYLAEDGRLDSFLKPALLDTTSVTKDFAQKFDKHVSEISEAAIEEERIRLEKKSITKKRQKEIREQIIAEELPKFQETLPEGVQLVEPSTSLSFRSNIKE